MDKNDGRILILGICLFFALGLAAGVNLMPVLGGSGWDFPAGNSVDIKATFYKELKYAVFLWTGGFLLKKESLVITAVILKGFIVGCAAAELMAHGGLAEVLVYIAPLQVFSCAAVILGGAAALYCRCNPVKPGRTILFLIYENFLIFLGVILEAIILKII